MSCVFKYLQRGQIFLLFIKISSLSIFACILPVPTAFWLRDGILLILSGGGFTQALLDKQGNCYAFHLKPSSAADQENGFDAERMKLGHFTFRTENMFCSRREKKLQTRAINVKL